MSTIAFVMLPEAGHYYAAFGIARKLVSRDHRVCFWGIKDFEESVRSQGLEFIPFLDDLFPKGFTRPPTSKSQNERQKGLLQVLKEEGKRIQKMHEFWFSDEITKLLSKFKPDLFIVDSFLPFVALVAYRYNIPCLMLSVILPQAREDHIPPITTCLMPDRAIHSKFIIKVSWNALFLRNFIGMKLASLFGIDINFSRLMKELAKISNYPLQYINTKTAFVPSLNMPELVLCPREFDFPRPIERKNRFYIESSIDLERKDKPFPWNKISNDKPLLFCTMGSQSHQGRRSKFIFQMVIDAMAARPDWQLVVAIGEYLNVNDFKILSPNVTLVNWAPHAEILKRASIMINHGGLGTVKECIYYGVPMIVFPFMRDQLGNAARVAYHGLGILFKSRKVNVRNILSSIEKIERNPSFRERVESLGKKFRQIEDSGIGIRVIEHFLK